MNKTLLESLCKKCNIRLMYAFGSRAKEVLSWAKDEVASLPASSSDVDIAILTEKQLPVEQKAQLTLALEDIFDVSRVDLVSLGEADPFLAANIIRGERLYAENKDDADEYDLYILRRAGDLAEFERERIELVLREKPTNYDA